MKYLSFVIPCYNSSAYMGKCIDSILPLGDDVEILIIDDGSTKDNTLDIAKMYEKKYPKVCKAIYKPNGGHGDAVMCGLKNATGKYMKVVDSDDWIDTKVGKKLLSKIIELDEKKINVDLFVTNYMYDKVGAKNKKVMSYKAFSPNKVLSWKDCKKFEIGSYMLMHSLCYRTKILRDSKLSLPKHTFYVDNIYAYKPFPYVKKIYYLNETLYHYYIGREDQSVNEKVMISRLDQQYKVTRIMLYDVELDKVKDDVLRNYMLNYMSIIMTVTSVLSIRSNEDKWLKEKSKLWIELKNKNSHLYSKLRFSPLGLGVNLPGHVGRAITVLGYKLANKAYGFN